MFTGLESPLHLLILLSLVLVLFGAKRLPEIGRSLGSGMREFRESITGHAPAADAQVSADGEHVSPTKATAELSQSTQTGEPT